MIPLPPLYVWFQLLIRCIPETVHAEDIIVAEEEEEFFEAEEYRRMSMSLSRHPSSMTLTPACLQQLVCPRGWTLIRYSPATP